MEEKSSIKIVAVVILAIAAILFINSFRDDTSAPAVSEQVQQKREVAQKEQVQQKKEVAQKELDELIKLMKEEGLVQSYEFSESQNVVYVGKVWYTQNVQFKKDFLAKLSTLKETITGYHRFEVRDALSNEKVAEVTAFSGSLEVYK